MQTRLPKTKCVWPMPGPMKINVICTVAVKYGSLPSDDDLTSSNSETEQDDLVSDEHGAS